MPPISSFKNVKFAQGAKDLAVTLFSRGSLILIGLAMQSLLAWSLGPEGRGEYAICLVFSSLSAVFFSVGVDWAVSYYFSTSHFSRSEVLSFMLLYLVIISCVIFLVLPYVIRADLDFFHKAQHQFFQFAIVWTVANIAYSFSTSMLGGMRAFNLLAVVTLVKSAIAFVGAFILLRMTPLGVRAPILADSLGSFVVMIMAFAFTMRRIEYRWVSPSIECSKQVLNYGTRMFVGSAGMIANTHMGTVLLSFYVASRELGFFSLSMSFLGQFTVVADVIARIIQPRIAASPTGRPDLVSFCARTNGSFVFIAGVVLVVSANWWVPIFFSDQFLPIIPVITILIPGIWLRVIGKTLFPFFNGTNRPEIVSISTFINLVINLGLLLLLLGPLGLEGAAWATTCAYIISTIYVVCKYRQVSGSSIREIFLPHQIDIKSFFRRLGSQSL